MFELANVDEQSKVVVVYPTTYSAPTIWFYSGQMHFTYLAEDFTTYFRMCLAHLGIPCWQYAFAKEGIPEWTREMFNLLAPGVLSEDRNLVEVYKPPSERLNKIDPGIFSTVQNCSNLPAQLERVQNNPKQLENNKAGNKEKPVKAKSMPRRAMSCKNKKSY